jgi:neutral amino acid transport system permease protein
MAGAVSSRPEVAGLRVTERVRATAGAHPGYVLLAVLVALAVVLATSHGLHDLAQRSVNGLVAGSYFALAAVGLTLVYGILKLVNFAHGDFLTLGAYVALLFNVTLGLPLVPAVAAAIALTAAVALVLEPIMWRPMRGKSAGMLQLLLMSIGLAFVIRYGVQLIAGSQLRTLDIGAVTSVEFLGLRIGATQLIVVVTGVVVLGAVAALLRYTTLGKQMRALSDDPDLAETTGIDTDRIVLITWIFAGGLAGLAGVLLVASTGSLTPSTGFSVLLPVFAAAILGGIGNAYGALVGGLVIGVTQEWSTLVIESRWKVAVGFAILILALLVRPQGIFGRQRVV